MRFTDLALRVMPQMVRAEAMATPELTPVVGATEGKLRPVLNRLRQLGLLNLRRADSVVLVPGR